MDWEAIWDRVSDFFNGVMEGVNRGLLTVFGDSNKRAIQKLHPRVAAINELEPGIQALSDEELKDQTRKFRERLAAGETIDDLLVEAFAVCREAGRRFLNMRHYDVQLMGGMVLHNGTIAEMVTGEGKTLVATLAAYLNALSGRGVHVVTVNDYLARRDSEWMSPIYTGLGLTVGAIQSSMDPHMRQPLYACDITYGTNNEFGFDYLRDNMKPSRELQCQPELHYAIIDEVDSILIDEARTPLIISGPAIDDPMKYARSNRFARQLKRGNHFEVNEKDHNCHMTDAGILEAEKLVGVESFYTAGNMEWPHLFDNALKALHLYKRDKDYIVDHGEIIIIDEHTGRKMEGRQWSDGLHQAVEAKEGVRIKEETQTLATITFQNFFKLYEKIAGMTGTAMTEASEFYKIYKLDVIAIPTNVPLVRENYPDVIFCTEKEKWKAIVEEVKLVHRTGRPILVGTTSVEKSEYLSDLFKRSGIKHEVLNAKFVEREADIVAQAGRKGVVTLSTNMAGRGTDIILGGNPEAMAWAQLKHEYPTRLEVPPEVWQAALEPFEEPMATEGRQVASRVPTLELAKSIKKVENPDRLSEVVDAASRRQLRDPEKLAEQNSSENVKDIEELIRLREAAHRGGLHIVGTERHESRRIDNQLRGRAGRQGDPGSSRFFLSLEDDLMRIFAGDWVRSILQRLGMQEGEAIESRMVSRRIAGAQKKVEERNFEIRKNLLEYDEIMDTQRKRVYGYRQAILEGANCKTLILEMIDRQIDKAVENFLARDYGTNAFSAWVSHRLGTEFDSRDFRRCEFEQAERIAKEESLRQAESAIIDQIDENLGEEVDPREWNWEAIASWGNSRWGLKLKAYDLKRVGREDVDHYLYEQVIKLIEQVHLEGGAIFFEPDFSRKALLGWANMKFAMDLDLADLGVDEEGETEPISDWLKQKSREVYDRKDVEFPVLCGMTRFMAEKNTLSTSRYDRDGLLDWAGKRFDVQIDRETYRNLPRQKVQEKLVGIGREFFRNGEYSEEIERRIEKAFGSEDEVSSKLLRGLADWSNDEFGLELDLSKPRLGRAEVQKALFMAAEGRYRPELRETEWTLLLQFLDNGWKDHLYAMDHLRSGIGLVGYAQIDPKVEYKRKGKQIFEEMWRNFDDKVTDLIFRVEEADTGFVSSIWHVTNMAHEALSQPAPETGEGIRDQQDAAIEMSQGPQKTQPIRNQYKKVGRNQPCPCGSGKKYKNCCMRKRGRQPA